MALLTGTRSTPTEKGGKGRNGAQEDGAPPEEEHGLGYHGGEGRGVGGVELARACRVRRLRVVDDKTLLGS